MLLSAFGLNKYAIILDIIVLVVLALVVYFLVKRS